MKIKTSILIFSCLISIYCGGNRTVEKIGKNDEQSSEIDLAKAVLDFSKSVLGENLDVYVHYRVPSNYLDIQMIFEADDFKSDHFTTYTSYSNKAIPDHSTESNYDGFILFAARYKDEKSAAHAFQVLKSNTKIRLAELEGRAGLLVEQVQILEKIRQSGGLFTQKGEYVFYLLESCEAPPIGTSWQEYEKLFLNAIGEKDEKIEIIDANCKEDQFRVQMIKIQ